MENSTFKVIDNTMAPRFGHTLTLVHKNKAVLFGGATGSNGRFSINSDTYVYYIDTKQWLKIEPNGNIPSSRAAHASCCVNIDQMVVYGGATGSGGLAPDELYLLDLKKGEQNSEWIVVPVKGNTPGRRYGHSLVYLKPFLILFGGNFGNEAVNDVWIFNSEVQPLQWSKLDITSELPPARVYHTAAVCNYGFATGMMVIFGGRRKDNLIVNDMWGLRKHRNGNWDWTKAPYKGNPRERQQHSSLFCGNFLINMGGRTAATDESLPIEVYDTETSEWISFENFKRFRHAAFIVDSYLYAHGGLEDEKNNTPTNILQEINLLEMYNPKSTFNTKILKYLEERKKSSNSSANSPQTTSNPHSPNSLNASSTLKKSSPIGNRNVEKGLHFSQKAEFAMKENNKDFGDLVRIVSLERLQEEKLKKQDLLKMIKSPKDSDIHEKVIAVLLRPSEWIDKPIEPDQKFDFEVDMVLELINRCIAILEDEPVVARLEAPVKIFGDIHGQYQDLMRFFDLYNSPIEGPGGDIEGLDYLFLGDYVDRGTHSLETMCLLLALKIKYPSQIFLLRGNHEDRWINSNFGFLAECMQRVGDDPENPIVFNYFNDLFDMLPLAAIINDTVLCLHGGIGSSLTSIHDIDKIKRPLEVIHEVTNIDQQLVVDILWSDPTDSDMETGILPNTTRDPTGVGNIVKFGPDRVSEFLKNNNLGLVIRAHECVMDGFERFAGGKLITVFSATDYCGKHKNAGAILYLTNKFEIKPYLIYPYDSPNCNWDNSEEAMKLRPPTPPRSRNNDPQQQQNRKNSFS